MSAITISIKSALMHSLVPHKKTLNKYGEENALEIYGDQKLRPLPGRSISNRQLASLMITASSIRTLVTKYLLAHHGSQTSHRLPGYTSSKLSK